MKRLFIPALLLGAALCAAALAFAVHRSSPPAMVDNDSRPVVVVSMFHIAEWTKAIAGDAVRIELATPSGIEPHDFVPAARDITAYATADLVIGNGGGVDVWAEKVRDERQKNGRPTLILADKIALVDQDPHFWLDPILAAQAVDAIAAALTAVDTPHAAMYAAGAAAEKSRLAALDAAYRTTLSECSQKHIIVAHDAFRYLGRRYGLTVHGILGLSADDEPSAQELVMLARNAATWGVTTIFFETLAAPDVAHTLADELHLKTAVLNPIEGLTTDEAALGVTYHSLMTDNLRALSQALCQK